MVAAELPANASLAELLSARARRTPRDRLAIDVVGGLLIAGTAVWARPGGWLIVAAAAGCFTFYGIWALAERHLLPRPWPERPSHEGVWEAVQGAAAVLGVGSFVLLLLAALGVGLGSITS
ncbi:MAG: hypothetical protein KJZ74_15765 [Gemmatimonadales bacterium]|nr:hypothetical protein [Gemmatimonadales bacterium]